jgi:aryl-alcohol dehydrogenase-like predicted oxidoreductase
MRFESKKKPNISAFQNALLRHYARPIQVCFLSPSFVRLELILWTVAKIDAVQAEYSAFETLHETDSLIDTAKELGVAYVAYSPLGHGWLVDDFPYKSPDDFAPDDFRRSIPKFQGENFYKNRAIVDEIKKLASRKGCTLTQIALAWVAAQGMIAIPGTTKAGRLEENFASREIDLTEEEKAEMRKILDAAKPVGNRYAPAHQAMVGH